MTAVAKIGHFERAELRAVVHDGRSFAATFDWPGSTYRAWLIVETSSGWRSTPTGAHPDRGQVPKVRVALRVPIGAGRHRDVRVDVERGARRPGWRSFLAIESFDDVEAGDRRQVRAVLELVGEVVASWPLNRPRLDLDVRLVEEVGEPLATALLDALSNDDLRRVLNRTEGEQ